MNKKLMIIAGIGISLCGALFARTSTVHALAVREGAPLSLPANLTRQTIQAFWVPPTESPAFTNLFNSLGPGWSDGRLSLSTCNVTPFNSNPNFYKSSLGGPGFVGKNKYFLALHYSLPKGSTLTPSQATYFSDSTTYPLTGTGWLYMVIRPTNQYGFWWKCQGSCVIDSAYAINLTTLADQGVLSDPSLGQCIALFGGRRLLPGQNGAAVTYPKENGQVVQTLKVTGAGGTVKRFTHPAGAGPTSFVINGGDTLAVDCGSVAFQAETPFAADVADNDWSPYRWVVCGDSLSDPTLDPLGGKYYDIIQTNSGIRTVITGKGSSGYYALHGDGLAFFQRLQAIPPDTDIVTLFGSVNDWKWYQTAGVKVGTETDDLESAETVAAYINKAIDIVQARAPVARIVMMTGLYYYGVSQTKISEVYAVMERIAARRNVRFVDWYGKQNEQGYSFPHADDYEFKKINRETCGADFAAVYTRDYSATASAYGHPSAAFNAEWLAPAFVTELSREIAALRTLSARPASTGKGATGVVPASK